MTDLAATIRRHHKEYGLCFLSVAESLNGLQALAKYEDRITGPWGVGCHTDPVVAIELALQKGVPQNSAVDLDDLLV